MDQRRDPLIPSSDQSEKDDLDGAKGEISMVAAKAVGWRWESHHVLCHILIDDL
jgi:hypothetical protein